MKKGEVDKERGRKEDEVDKERGRKECRTENTERKNKATWYNRI